MGAIISLSKTFPQVKRKIQVLIFVFSFLMVLVFVFLFIWPYSARNTSNYSVYLIYNGLLSFDFIFKIPLTLSFLIGLISLIKRNNHPIYWIGLIISICLSSSILYGTFPGKRELVVNHIQLEFKDLPVEFDGYEFVQFSDIHLGSFIHSKKLMKKTLKEINKINPSLVLFTGDLINNFSEELDGWNEIFNGINKDRKSYSILGNHDYGNYTNWDTDELKKRNFKKIVESHSKFGFQLLRNENVKLFSGRDSIFIIGVENWGHPPFPQYANLEKAMSGIPETAFKILMTHDPAHWELVVKERQDVDLSLSGHTHGMQWGIKKAGITFSFSYFISRYWSGLYRFGNSQLYVNTGLGTVGIPWRINMPAELTVFKLKRIEVN